MAAENHRNPKLRVPRRASVAGSLALVLTASTGSAPAEEPDPARATRVESEIEAGWARQRVLRSEREAGEERGSQPIDIADTELEMRAALRTAPPPPELRDIPPEVFDEARVTIPARQWENLARIRVVQRTLDADRDGQAEEVRYYDRQTGLILRMERDRDYDGELDTWLTWRDGRLVSHTLDTNGDTRADVWEQYDASGLTDRAVDRDYDGVRDAFFVYKDGELVEERHDHDNDGRIDVFTFYVDRIRVETREDRNGDGEFDTRISFQVVDGEEIPRRVERATDGAARPDVIETFEGVEGRAVLVRREEDANGDGSIDIISIYENGKLVRREISDASLLPPANPE